MSPLYPSNEWSDINIYETIGKAIMNGKTLYVDIFDHKGPLIFIIYGLANLFIPYKFLGMFIILYVLWLSVLVHLFFSLSKIIPKSYALVACACTCYFALNYMHTGGSPEEFILLADLFLLSIVVRFTESIQRHNYIIVSSRDYFVLGLFSSMILLLKFNLFSFYFFILIGFIFVYLQKKKYGELKRFVLYYVIGLAIMMLLVLGFLYLTDALSATIDTYILLNKKMVSSDSFQELFRLGAKRIIELFKYHALGTIVFLIGGFLFPLVYLKQWSLKICFLLAVTSTIFILYFMGITHFYYTLPLYCLIPIGLLTIVNEIQKRYQLKENILGCTILLFIVLAISITQTNFWGLSFHQLKDKGAMPGVNYQFAKTITQQSTSPTLLVLSFGDAINVFTLCDIIPNIKYFSILNIDYSVYPDLRDTQQKVIDNKDVEFIILNEGSGYFNTYEPLLQNYSMVDTFEGYEEYQNVKIPKRTFLYRRK